MREITASGIRCETIMIESGGRLVDHVAESRSLRRQSLAALAS
jgi:hypothetical protein